MSFYTGRFKDEELRRPQPNPVFSGNNILFKVSIRHFKELLFIVELSLFN